LGLRSGATKAKFPKQGALIDSLEKARTQGVGDFKDGTGHALGQGIEVIGVHRRSSAANIQVRTLTHTSQNGYWPPMNADERRFWGATGIPLSS